MDLYFKKISRLRDNVFVILFRLTAGIRNMEVVGGSVCQCLVDESAHRPYSHGMRPWWDQQASDAVVEDLKPEENFIVTSPEKCLTSDKLL